MASLALRISIFFLLTISYILFLVALAERYVLLPQAQKSTKVSSALNQNPLTPSPRPLNSKVVQQQQPLIPYSSSLLLDKPKPDGIEICTDTDGCYTFIPGMKFPKIASSTSVLTPEGMVTKSGSVIRSATTWAWSVLRRGLRPRGYSRSSSRRRSSSIVGREGK